MIRIWRLHANLNRLQGNQDEGMKHNILVVGNPIEVAEFIKAILEREEYAVTTTLSLEEAKRITKQELTDLVIADVDISRKENLDFLKDIKRKKETKEIFILLLTAGKKSKADLSSVEIDGVMAKPINAAYLMDNVHSLLKRCPEDGQSRPERPSLEIMDEIILEAEDSFLEKRTKAVLFGFHETVLSNMSRQLAKAGWQAVVVKDEKHFFSKIEKVVPDLIFLEFREEPPTPIDRIVFAISSFISERTDEFHSELNKVKIVVYKAEELPWLSAKKEAPESIDEIIERCRDFWDVRYLGSYNAVLFIQRIKEVLK